MMKRAEAMPIGSLNTNNFQYIINLIFRRRSSSKQHEEPTIDLFQALTECEEINQLFFQNHLNEALKKAKAQYALSYIFVSIQHIHFHLIERIVRYIIVSVTVQLVSCKLK